MNTPGLLMFCLRSLWREYGLMFLGRIVLRHPARALRGIRAYAVNIGKERASGTHTDDPSLLRASAMEAKPLSIQKAGHIFHAL
jgi:hypothetical protein